MWKQNVFFAWVLIQLAVFCLLGQKKSILLDELQEPLYYNVLYPLSISTANSIVILANFYLIISIEFLDCRFYWRDGINVVAIVLELVRISSVNTQFCNTWLLVVYTGNYFLGHLGSQGNIENFFNFAKVSYFWGVSFAIFSWTKQIDYHKIEKNINLAF